MPNIIADSRLCRNDFRIPFSIMAVRPASTPSSSTIIVPPALFAISDLPLSTSVTSSFATCSPILFFTTEPDSTKSASTVWPIASCERSPTIAGSKIMVDLLPLTCFASSNFAARSDAVSAYSRWLFLNRSFQPPVTPIPSWAVALWLPLFAIATTLNSGFESKISTSAPSLLTIALWSSVSR